MPSSLEKPMARFWKTFLTLSFVNLISLGGAAPAWAADGVQGPLVQASWLAQNLESSDFLILDAQPAPMHRAAHIPGAVSANLYSYGELETPPAEVERRLQSWGVSPGRKILVVDQGGTYNATKLFYDLHYHGMPVGNLFILDGGMAKWKAVGGAVTAEPTPAPARGSFRLASPLNEAVRARLPEFVSASGDTAGNALVDALDASMHFGEMAFFDRVGHVPHAILWPTSDVFNADKTFKSADEIRRMLAHLGIRPEQTIYAHCGGGLAASVPYFAIKHIAGYSKVKLFNESQMGWLQDDRGLPFWTYSAPNMMRDWAWLKGWNNKMMRSFGVAPVSIIDVRSPEAYKQGHIPFALNVPAEVFRAHIEQPARLAELLSQAGVNVMHEAVVVSESGLDGGAALAYLALEKLGQKRVSVLMDPLERAAELGMEVVREPTLVGPSQKPGDMAIPITPYPARSRGAVLAGDAKGTPGVFPRVFVAPGKKVPAKLPASLAGAAPDGAKLVHLPYTDLLAKDGRPKAAKDLWNAIAKAGVPRYAEIVFVAEDAGDAAAAIYLFRLMGFADVKAQVL
jgi:3-mercaptopyruvate sulfurtransferase SseA